ncbi:MAG: hypothetical protein AB7U73_21465 [Pirellulales bacterium]
MPRPISVIVFGTLNLVFGVFSLLSFGMQLILALGFANAVQPQFSGGYQLYQTILTPIAVAAVFAQLASGIGLLMLREWARKLAIGFAIYTLLASVLNVVMMVVFRADFMGQFTATMPNDESRRIFIIGFLGAMVFGTLIWLAYPTLMWYFMTRPHVKAAFRGEAPPERDYGELGASAMAVQAAMPAGPTSDNPFDAPAAWHAPAGGAAVGGPATNEAAATALYLGIGSLIPCLAIGLGPAAVVVGRRALADARLHPQRGGETQAYFGILLGGGCFVLNIGFLVLGLTFTVMGMTMAP